MSLVQDLITRNRNGEAIGLPCFCTANEQVIRAILSYAKKTGFPTVIEATCNQLNDYRLTPVGSLFECNSRY